MGLLDKAKLNTIGQGLLGNLSQQGVADLEKEYSKYIFEGEKIMSGFKLIRDALIFTNLRVIFFDKQGATGQKMSVKSIYLSNIVDVEMETSGFGFDDSELTIYFLTNIRTKAHGENLDSHKFEFPKKFDVSQLYRMLGEIVLTNRARINE